MSMTENEAIEELKTSIGLAKMCTLNSERKKEIEAYAMAIQALEEIQAYRAIGTPAQIYLKIGGLDVELGKYYAIGTVEECRVAVERMKPKKAVKDEYDRLTCPNCTWIVYPDEYGGRSLPCCENCGQAIDWSE